MADLIRLYNDAPGTAPARAAASPSSGLLRLYKDAPAPATSSNPSAPNYNQPSYGGSNIKDTSGKPLETTSNPKAAQSQLLKDRVYPGFDPMKPQKLQLSMFSNSDGRMPRSVSDPLRAKMGAGYNDELDHAIALELSGSNDRSNLMVEPGLKGGVAATHDKLENKLARDVVNGDRTGVSLLDAQRQLAKAKGNALTEDLPDQGQTSKAPSIGERALDAYPSTMQTLSELQMDPASIKADPHKAITDYWNGVKDSVQNAGESIAQFLESRGGAESVGATGKAAAATVGAVLSPITSLFSSANDIPVVGTFSKLLTLPFQFMGDAGYDTAKVLVDSLPIDQDAKDKIVDGVGDILALAGQFAIGAISEKAGKALDEAHLVKKYGLKDANTIVDKAKEIAAEKTPAPAEHPSPAPVELPDKPLAERTAPPPTIERAGAVNPEAFLDSAKEALAKAKEGHEAAKYGEAVRTYFTGERDSRVAETNQLRDQLSKGLSSQEQEALTLMRDFKNKPGELDAFTNGSHDAFGKLPPAERTAAVERVQTLKPIIDLAKNPTENMKAADAAMTDYFTKHLDEGKKLGFLDSKIGNDEYISHLLQPKEDAGKVVSKGGSLRTYKIGRNTPFSKERAYPTVLHAVANGVEPRTLNALDALAIYGDKHATAAATRLLVGQLKDSGVAKWGSHGSENIPADWKPIAPENNRLFQNQRAFVDEAGNPGLAHQSLFAPEKVVDALRPLTDPDFTDRIPGFKTGKLYQGYLKAVELSLSVFHLKALNITALGNEGVSGLVKTYASDMKSPAFLDVERGFIKAGGTSPILGRTIEAYRALEPSSIPSRMDVLRRMPVVKQLDQAAAGVSKLTFDIIQRKMKVTDFALKDAKWIADHPEATPEAHYVAQRGLAKEINATYGGLNWEALGINKMTQSLLRFGLLAPDWTFSNFFNVKGVVEGGAGGKAARAFWIRSAITGVVLSEATSFLFTHKLSKDPTNVTLGKDKNGKDIKQNLFFAGAPNDGVNLINNIRDYGPVSGLAQTLLGKSNAFIRTGFEVGTNRNYLGQTIVPKGAGPLAGTALTGKALAQELAPVPFTFANFYQMFTDPQKQYTEKEYITTLLGGTRPRHVVPDGMRQVTTGKKKGDLVPATPKQKNSALDIIKGRPLYKPAPKK